MFHHGTVSEKLYQPATAHARTPMALHWYLSNKIHGTFPTGGMLHKPFPPLEFRDKRRTLSASGVDLLISPPPFWVKAGASRKQ